MAYTTPKTYTAAVLTAAELNTYQRDNIIDLNARANTFIYAVTLADADNTASEIVVYTCTVAQAVSDADRIDVLIIADHENDSGGAEDIQFDCLFGGVEATIHTKSIPTAAGVNAHGYLISLIRAGSDLEVAFVDGFQTGGTYNASIGVTLASPTFTAGQTLSIKVTLGTAHASLYFRPQAGHCLHVHQ